ncbi:aldehyde dehydrogenase [Erysipelothrix sp. HDW6A]|uniref:aldehyde dehydrogenase n=1 Tax=Erysipelothrix sp. HDW6A TaxID=2714928 RepID=UPI00140D0F6A|nr:aldehyde dehydrogenase [Erysipelothrix sp. HDW6A]QIK56861.1 aldehyde dehydrogenase [Erysipelothrix sp. HDW6A]
MQEHINYSNLVARHQDYFQSQKTRSLEFRLLQLNQLRQGILKYEDDIIEALRIDLGRHPQETYSTEIGFCLSNIRSMEKKLPKYMKKEHVRTPLVLLPSKSYSIYEPYGTALIMGPFNYPFQLLIEPLIGAIAAGNCAVLKPSEMVPNFSRVITEMIEDTFESQYISSVEGDIETNTALLECKFDTIFFTGSTQVGKIVMKKAAEHLTPVTLELGGKSPAIVTKDADIKRAARRIIYGKTLNAGQTCVAPDYVLVDETIKETFVNECKQVLFDFYGTDCERSDSFSRIVNERHFNRLTELIEASRTELLSGGHTNPTSRFIEPSLFASSWDSPLMQDEIFGPLLPILSYQSLEESINEINKRPKPLALYVFSKDKKIQDSIINRTSSGGVTINNTIFHLVSDKLPFGGVGDSGIGHYHGKYSFETFSHKRAVLKTTRFDVPFITPPYSMKKLSLIKKIMK